MSAARAGRRARRDAIKHAGGSRAGQASASLQPSASASARPVPTPDFFGSALWLSLALILANLLVFAPVRRYGFVNWDDPEYVSVNSHISAGLTWQGVRWAFTTTYFFNWHPLTWLSYMLNVQLFGMNAGPQHLTNVLLHITNTLLLFWLLHRMTGALGRSAFVAGLFAVHPLHVESVAWVSERKDVLSTLFGLLAIWAYVKYVHRPRLGRYLVVVLLFALSLMAKPMLVTLPFVLLLLDFWPLGRMASVGFQVSGAREKPSEPRPAPQSPGLRTPGRPPAREPRNLTGDTPNLSRLVREKLPLFALTAASSIITFVAQQRSGSVAKLEVFPWNRRVENALLSYFSYVGKTLWPARLAAFYPLPRSLPAWWVGAVGAALGLIGVSVAVIWAGRRHPYLPVGWLWYLGTLVPVIGLVQVGDQSMADRYTYIPLIGLFIAVTWGVVDLLARWPYRKIALPLMAALVISACAITARGQVRYWRDDFALWAHAAEVTEENHVAHNALGLVLAGQGRTAEAITHYSEALRIEPNNAEVHNNLGIVLAGQGRTGEAMAHYSEALRIEPDSAIAHNNLGRVLAGQGRTAEATAHFSEALRIQPDFAEAHYNLGVVLAVQGKTAEAMTHFSEALRTQPNNAEAHNNLGAILADQGRTAEAMAHYSEALRLQPDYADAHKNLALTFSKQGRVAAAIQELAEALRINPGDLQARRTWEELTRRSNSLSSGGGQ